MLEKRLHCKTKGATHAEHYNFAFYVAGLETKIDVSGRSPSNITLHNSRAYVTLQDRGSIATFDI